MRQIQLMLLLSIMVQRGWSEDQNPQQLPAIAGVEDVIVKIIQVPAQYFLNESMEATLEIQNISEKKIRFGWKAPIVTDLELKIDQNILQLEQITPKPLELVNGSFLPVIIAPKMTWRGKIFLDSYFDLRKSTSQPIPIRWKFGFRGSDQNQSGVMNIPVISRRSEQDVVANAQKILVRLNESLKVQEAAPVSEELFQSIIRIESPLVIPYLKMIEDQGFYHRAMATLVRFPRVREVEDLARELIASNNRLSIHTGLRLSSDLAILHQEDAIRRLLNHVDKDVQAATIAYIGRMLNGLCLAEVAAKTQDPYLPLADAASRAVLGINPKLPLHVYDAGADPFGNPVVPLPNPPPKAQRPSEYPLPEKAIKLGDDGF